MCPSWCQCLRPSSPARVNLKECKYYICREYVLSHKIICSPEVRVEVNARIELQRDFHKCKL